VTWAVAESGGGTVISTGLYTAPLTAGTYHVRAKSVADATKTAEAAVTVTTPAAADPLTRKARSVSGVLWRQR
jgi:hypothetical protein